MIADQKIVRLKIVLDHVESKVERWLVVAVKICLDRLYDVLQGSYRPQPGIKSRAARKR